MNRPIATFSIVAYDPGRQEWGVAVQSKFLACAAVVSWARAGAGAVATQSFANVAYGLDGLDMMEQDASAEETIAALTAADEQRAQRQVGMVDKRGQAAAFTGAECYDWAGELADWLGRALAAGHAARRPPSARRWLPRRRRPPPSCPARQDHRRRWRMTAWPPPRPQPAPN